MHSRPLRLGRLHSEGRSSNWTNSSSGQIYRQAIYQSILLDQEPRASGKSDSDFFGIRINF
jgi:hypothetical protein